VIQYSHRGGHLVEFASMHLRIRNDASLALAYPQNRMARRVLSYDDYDLEINRVIATDEVAVGPRPFVEMLGQPR
jgi:hypothetical protein